MESFVKIIENASIDDVVTEFEGIGFLAIQPESEEEKAYISNFYKELRAKFEVLYP